MIHRTSTRKKRVVQALAATACALAVAGPAAAGEKSILFVGVSAGWSSGNWYDGDGGAGSRVTTWQGCSRDFTGHLMKNRWGPLPDSTYGKERVNCTQYDDAVRSDGATPTGDYHFSIGDLGGGRTTGAGFAYW